MKIYIEFAEQSNPFAPIAIVRPFYGTMSYDGTTLALGDLSGFGVKYYYNVAKIKIYEDK